MERLLKHRLERVEPRYATNVEAVLFCEGFATPARIMNISMYGALMECRHLPQAGSTVSIITEGKEISATVIWIGADRFGVLFSGSVDPSEFTQIGVNDVG